MVPLKTVVSLVVSVVYCLLWSSVGQAQPVGRNSAMRAPVFVGAALTLTAPDSSARMRLANEASIGGWFGEVGLPIKGRLGAGVEFSGTSDATGETRGISFESRGRQRERTVIGLAKVRVVGTSRLGVDLIGGAGTLFQHHEALESSCVVRPVCSDFTRTTLDRRAPAFVVGADVPLRIAGPIMIGAVARYSFLDRGRHQTQPGTVFVPWQFEWRSSTRVSVGVDLRIGR